MKTLEQAQRYLNRLSVEILEFDTSEAWDVLVNAAPVPVVDQETDEVIGWTVHVGWHCWVRNSKTAIPLEYGLVLSLDSEMPAAAVYATLEHGWKGEMERMRPPSPRSFRSDAAAKAAVFS